MKCGGLDPQSISRIVPTYLLFFFLTNVPTYNLQLENGKCHQIVSQQWYVKCTNNSSLFFKPQIGFPNTSGNSQLTLAAMNHPILNDFLVHFLSQSHSSMTFHSFSGLIVTFLSLGAFSLL